MDARTEGVEGLDSPFPSHIGWAAVTSDTLGVFTLDPAEAGLLSERCAARRRASFAMGRAAAVRALAAIGVARVPVLAGELGEPLWPAGVVGSISHTEGVAIACAGHGERVVGLGVDVERADRCVRLDLVRRVCTDVERAWVEAGAGDDRRCRLLRLVAAKEATFKACFPLARVFLGFADAELVWSAAGDGFEGRLLRAVSAHHSAGTPYRARVREVRGYVVASVELGRPVVAPSE